MSVLAAGGIANGRSLAAVLAAGADGAWVGTAFVQELCDTAEHCLRTRVDDIVQ